MSRWALSRAEEHLQKLDVFGMSFGLERISSLLDVLGSPQREFSSIHVVGTNGKTSTAVVTAALLEAHGKRTGVFTSPHLLSFVERIAVGGSVLPAEDFALAVQDTASAAVEVEPDLVDGDHVTQFELLTAAGFLAFARANVDVAVIEAGLGGRYDATNVIDAAIVVLTNVGLEHTRWLGETTTEIAKEKLAVASAGATLVTGCLDGETEAEVARTVAERDLKWVKGCPGMSFGFQDQNRTLAKVAAQAWLQRAGGSFSEKVLAKVAEKVSVPGRFQTVSSRPRTLVDGAHNPAGIEALVRALQAEQCEGRIIAVVSILDDKDAAKMLRSLLPICKAVIFTRSASSRALEPRTLASIANQLDGPSSEICPDPRLALARAQALADVGDTVVATGSLTFNK